LQREAEHGGRRLDHDEVRHTRTRCERISQTQTWVGVERRAKREDQIRFSPGRGFLAESDLPHDATNKVVPLMQT
jgi:hypothetical protein